MAYISGVAAANSDLGTQAIGYRQCDQKKIAKCL